MAKNKKPKGTYTDDVLRIVNTPPGELKRMSVTQRRKYLETLTWFRKQERIAAAAEKAASKQKREAERKAEAVPPAMPVSARTIEITPKSVAGFLWGPNIKATLRPFGFAYAWFVQTLAQTLMGVGLLVPDHPARTLNGARAFKIGQVLAEARRNLLPVQLMRDAFRANSPKVALLAVRQYSIFTSIVGIIVLSALMTLRFLANIVFGAAFAAAGSSQNTTGMSIGNFAVSSDIASSIIDGIFGTGTGSQSLVTSGLGSMLAFYSNMILVFAGIILLWIIISAVAETARTGVPLGKQFNHVWAPIRLIVALGLLVPLGSGLNSGQWIVLSLSKWGSSQATTVWTIFAKNMIGTSGGSSSGITSAPLDVSTNRDFADQAFMPILCQQVNNEELNLNEGVTCGGGAGDDARCVEQNVVGAVSLAPTVTNAGPDGQILPTPPTNVPARITWANRTSGGQVNCGGVTVSVPSGTISAGANVLASDVATQAILVDQSNSAASYVANVTPLADAIAQASILFSKSGGSLSFDKTAAYNQYQTVFNQYMTGKTTALASTIKTYNGSLLNGMVEDAQKYGWIYAPVWIASVASQNGQIMDTAQVVPSVTAPATNPFAANATAKDAWTTATGIVNSWEPQNASANSPLSRQKFGKIANLIQQLTSQIGNNPLGQAGSYGGILLTEGFELITPADEIKCYQDPSQKGCAWAGQEALGQTVNPSVQFSQSDLAKYNAVMGLGQNATDGTILPDVAGAKQRFSQLEALTTGQNAHSSLRSVLFPIGMIMISVGFMLKLITLIVLGRFSLGVLNWLIMVFEGVLAVPFVSLSLLRTDGEGFLPQQVQTNMVMAAGLILRPILMVISLIIGLIAFNAIMEVVNILMAPTIQSLVSNGPTTDNSYLSLGVYMIFYATLAYTLANSAFKVIDVLPNFLMGWLGQRTESRVDDAAMVNQQAQSYMQTMAYSARNVDDPLSGYGRQQASQQWQREHQANVAAVKAYMQQHPGTSQQAAWASLRESGNLPYVNTGNVDPNASSGATGASTQTAASTGGAAGATKSAAANPPKVDPGSKTPTST